MFGIPTRSDVKNEKYQRAVIAEGLRRRLDEFSWPTSTCFIHNHVVGSEPTDLEPAFVLEHYIGCISRFREDLAKAASLGLVLPKIETISTAHPNQELYVYGPINTPMARTRKRGIAKKLVVVTPVKKPFEHDERDGFNIRYAPAELAEHELAEYETALKQAARSSMDPRKQLERMKGVIEKFDNSAHKELLSHGLVDSFNPEWPCSIEERILTKAHRLKKQNQRIAGASDIYLRFDEVYVVTKGQNVESRIPAQVLLDQSDPLTSSQLWHRQSIRDCIDRKVKDKGEFVFNGIKYTPQLTEGDKVDSYTASGSVPTEFTNILGIQTTNGKTTTPEEWAREEIKLARQYRQGDSAAASSFLEKYSGWGSGEHVSTRAEKLEHVAYVLNRKDSLLEALA